MTSHRRILIIAYAGQGHINPALQFAKRLVKMNVDVTFCTSLAVVRRIDNQTTAGITFALFSDGHDNGKQPNTSGETFYSDLATYGARAVAETITTSAVAGRPFDRLVYTTAIPWAATVAKSHGLKSTLLWCQSATVLDIYYYYFNGYKDLISGNNDNPSFPINLPGLPPITTADLPSFLLPSSPKEHDYILVFFKDHIDVLKTTPKILINTFNEFELEPIRAIEKFELFPIGPLIPSAFLVGNDPSDSCFGGDLFDKAEEDYIQWLNTKPKSSVVYFSFGTLAVLPTEQVEEIAAGLLQSRRPFLWVMRDAGEGGKLGKIEEELKAQGMIVSWCSQVEVLNHEAIGCFFTHCGWNSTLEAMAAGVPAVVFPQWSDQGTNGKMVEDFWKTGVMVRRRDGDGVVEGREIERCLEMVMGGGEKGMEMKKNAEKWKVLARDAVNNGGSSAMNLQAFLDDA